MKTYTKEKEGITFHYMDEKHTILHNENGMAIIWPNGAGHYYLSNKHYYKHEYDKIMAERK